MIFNDDICHRMMIYMLAFQGRLDVKQEQDFSWIILYVTELCDWTKEHVHFGLFHVEPDSRTTAAGQKDWISPQMAVIICDILILMSQKPLCLDPNLWKWPKCRSAVIPDSESGKATEGESIAKTWAKSAVRSGLAGLSPIGHGKATDLARSMWWDAARCYQ